MSGEATARYVEWRGAAAAFSEGDLRLAAQLSRAGLDRTPGDRDLLRLLLVMQLALRDIATAQETADRLAEAALTSASFEVLISARLADGRVACARDLVARAVSEGLEPAALEAARARIALHLGDMAAARAILVRGIERTPGATGLRALMAEVLMADGGAAHARDVIGRLGLPPTAPGPEAALPDRAHPPLSREA
ncbi:hypothetical protein [Roseicyclus sp.]|uniref:hypothetical protein n=1 Tax=Roseicyclus sp. TaxID=1914329 RepID=UPI003F9F65A6